MKKCCLSKKKCRNILTEHFIPVVLHVDDKIKLPEKYKLEVAWFDGSKKYLDTTGKLNQHYQFSKFQSNTQPFMVVLDVNKNIIINWLSRKSRCVLSISFERCGCVFEIRIICV